MHVTRQRLMTTALASLALLATTADAWGQQRAAYPIGVPYYPRPIINTNPNIAPGLSLQQYAYNTRVLAGAYSRVPPYLLGYNPYPQVVSVGATYPTVNYPSYNPGLMTGYNPYLGNPYLTTTPSAYGGGTLSTTPGAVGGYDTSLSTTPYGYPNPYNPYNPYGYGAGSVLSGAADLTNAAAQARVTIQKARLLQEDVTRSRLDTRRRILEEAERERARMPNPDDLRVKEQELATNRARRDPPVTELLAGTSLNDLYRHLANMQGKGFRGPNVPLEGIDMTQINLAPANEGGNIGLVKNLKPGEKLVWPSVLLDAAYKEPREKLDARITAAVASLRNQTPVPDADLRDLEDSVKKMVETLNGSIADLSPSQYITGKRFLSAFHDAITAMRSPKAINFFNGKWGPKGRNVAELINHMKEQGLKFAAASPGGEAAYKALHYDMVAYDANMTQVAASK